MNILIIEDDPIIAQAVQQRLETEPGVAVDWVGDIAALQQWRGSPDLALLDLNLPDSSSLKTVAQFRRRFPDLPVIIISALDATEVKIESLRTGADDYLAKPFSLDELAARVAALMRRAGQASEATADLRWEVNARRVLRRGRVLALTPLEYEIFQLLAERPGCAMSRAECLNRLVGSNFYGYDRVVDVHIGHLRKKLGPDGHAIIETVRAFGYRFNAAVAMEVMA